MGAKDKQNVIDAPPAAKRSQPWKMQAKSAMDVGAAAFILNRLLNVNKVDQDMSKGKT